jgi:hypothetical protein
MTPVAALTCPKLGLRCYRSPKAAREAHRRAGFRVRVFQCSACGLYHATAQSKGDKSE